MSVTVIGIGGGTGSGKSTIANAMADHLDAAVIRIDDYYRPLNHLTFEEREQVNFDSSRQFGLRRHQGDLPLR